MPNHPAPELPPETWMPARRLAMAVARPIESFLHVEAASGIVLLMAAAAALLWANSPFGESYARLWHTPVSLGIGAWHVEHDLHFWINELLMTVFFFVVGLEIKRELVEGALSDARKAALPIGAAVGGMVVPAAIYLALNPTAPSHEGWGVPMATDIAFAVGVLTLLGKRVPAALRVLLLALAIIDDIGAILVIALFYSTGFSVDGLAVAIAGLALLFLLRQIGVRTAWAFVPAGLVVWAGMYQTGVHPTIAGVVVGLLTPAVSWFGRDGFMRVAHDALDDFERRVGSGRDDHALLEPLDRLALARREALSPALRVEKALHPWVAYGVMPLFALANAGVNLRGIEVADPSFGVIFAGVVLGLVAGKPLGVLGVSWLMVKLRLAVLPEGVTWRGVLLVGAVAGIGFTMAIFIAQLAFADPTLLGIAKLGVLTATALAAALGLVGGSFLLPRAQPDELAAMTASDVEASQDYWTSGSGRRGISARFG